MKSLNLECQMVTAPSSHEPQTRMRSKNKYKKLPHGRYVNDSCHLQLLQHL